MFFFVFAFHSRSLEKKHRQKRIQMEGFFPATFTTLWDLLFISSKVWFCFPMGVSVGFFCSQSSPGAAALSDAVHEFLEVRKI